MNYNKAVSKTLGGIFILILISILISMLVISILLSYPLLSFIKEVKLAAPDFN